MSKCSSCSTHCTKCEKPDIKQLSKRNLTAIGLMFCATAASVVSILLDSLTVFRDDNDKIYAICSWQSLKYTGQYKCNQTSILTTSNDDNSFIDINDTSDTSDTSDIATTSYDDPMLATTSYYDDFQDTDINGTDNIYDDNDIIYDCLDRNTNFKNRCNDKSAWDKSEWCDTEYSGIYWFYSSIAGTSLIFITIIWNLFNYPIIGGTFGFFGWLGLILGVCCWIGLKLDFSFDFNGNEICFNEDTIYLYKEDSRFDIGDSLFIMFSSIVLSGVGWYMSCVANVKSDEELERLDDV